MSSASGAGRESERGRAPTRHNLSEIAAPAIRQDGWMAELVRLMPADSPGLSTGEIMELLGYDPASHHRRRTLLVSLARLVKDGTFIVAAGSRLRVDSIRCRVPVFQWAKRSEKEE